MARSLAKGATMLVALWMRDCNYYSPYYSYVQYFLQQQGWQRGYQLLSEDPLGSISKRQDDYRSWWPVDAILACDMLPEGSQLLQSRQGRKCPVVCVGLSEVENLDGVTFECYNGALSAVRHLIDTGRTNIVLVAKKHSNDRRIRAYSDVLSQAGLPTRHLVASNDGRQAAYEAMAEFVQTNCTFDAIFCLNDELALGCYVALQEAGVRVPEEVAIVGFDSLATSRVPSFPISSVRIPVEEMCRVAWDLVERRLADPHCPVEHISLPTQLEICASSSPLAK
jgi:LacI family transcriptional regulator